MHAASFSPALSHAENPPGSIPITIKISLLKLRQSRSSKNAIASWLLKGYCESISAQRTPVNRDRKRACKESSKKLKLSLVCWLVYHYYFGRYIEKIASILSEICLLHCKTVVMEIVYHKVYHNFCLNLFFFQYTVCQIIVE